MEVFKWSIVYYESQDEPYNGRVCNTIDEVAEFISRLDGYTHIDIVRFKLSDI